jgi:CDP-diacylglycerol--glycerol-3-phosphate 3-phosphatidyltransferase
VYLFFSGVDLLDGAVARATGQASDYGAVLDAVLDRSSEALVLVACGWYFGERDDHWYSVAAYCGLFGSVAVSYMRARAEVQGMSMREGLFRRQERVAVLGGGLLLGFLGPVVVVLAVLSNVTALQRFVMLGRGLRAMDAAQPPA